MTARVIESSLFATVAVALIVIRVRRAFQFVVVTGESMQPTFGPGDLVVGRRREGSLARGDVVVFPVYSDDYYDRIPSEGSRRVKRITAVAGDCAPANLPERLRRLHNGLVPYGHVALAGDAAVSEGSSEFGYINIERIESVIVRRLRRGKPNVENSRLPRRPDRSCPHL
jgi:signal peptidase I